MKIYTVGSTISRTYGHGDCGEEIIIEKEGGYGSGSFPPCFTTRQAAQKYLDNKKFSYQEKVVELQLIKQ